MVDAKDEKKCKVVNQLNSLDAKNRFYFLKLCIIYGDLVLNLNKL